MTKHLITAVLLLLPLTIMGAGGDELGANSPDQASQGPSTLSGLRPDRFIATIDGKQTALYTLTNNGLEACITNYGARVVSMMVPDQEGHLGDVVLGFDNINDYASKKQNFGSVVGRYVGRIKGARFALNGVPYVLQQTGGGNISHGGHPGFSDRVWDMVSRNDSSLCLKYVSPDGENGFPGTLTVKVTYTNGTTETKTVSIYHRQVDRGEPDQPLVLQHLGRPLVDRSHSYALC